MMTMNKKRVEPAAVAVGLGVAGLLFLVHHRRAARCTTFPNVYSKHGPIHLQPEIKVEAFDLAEIKIEEARISGAAITKQDIQLYLAEHFSEGCDWEAQLTTLEAKAVWEAYGKIAEHAIESANEPEDEED